MVDYSNLDLPDSINVTVLDSIHSTNDYLINKRASDEILVCIAREQTHGRGQYQRQWLSQKDSSITLSLRNPFPADIKLNGLSLVVGLAIVDVLQRCYKIKQLKLKWPNDIYFKHQKLTGILIENTIEGNRQLPVIGLGLNYHLYDNFSCESDWIDLSRIIDNLPDIVELQQKLILQIVEYCKLFERRGFGYFQSQWHQYDYLFNQKLSVKYNNEILIGNAQGVSAEGALLVNTLQGIVKLYSSEHIRLI